jgi:mannitol/fructose-specific phosphotransferase system IIA component (Ntr-type)
MKDIVERIAKKLGFPVAVLPDTAAGSVEAAVRFLINKLVQGGNVPASAAKGIVENILKRESLGSTALGGAVALPHATHSAVDRLQGILGRCSSPVPWKSPDGKRVETICLIIAPVDGPGMVWEKVAQALRGK